LEEFNRRKAATGGVANWLYHTGRCLRDMPPVMKRLAVVQFFTWMGLFCMWMFYTVAVAKHVFHATDVHSRLFEQGVGAAAQAMGFYNIVSTVFALLMPVFAMRIGRVNLHFAGLLLAGLGLLSVWMAEGAALLYVGMLGVGIGWACVLALPYAIIAAHIPQENYGIYMGIFNIFIVIPEILTTLVLGYVMTNWLGNSEIAVVTMGGVFLLIAAVLTFSLRRYQKAGARD
ncbi:MAG: MFS transporter, partial [Negativicutes bacterium]|nr:MFS transporter [Negativicutes bacterium]